MESSQNTRLVKLDLNNPEFQRNLFALDKSERSRVIDTLKKLTKLNWDQVYKDQRLKWEKITSVKLIQGINSLYSLRVTLSRRATATREGDFMRFQTIQQDHDSTYGKK